MRLERWAIFGWLATAQLAGTGALFAVFGTGVDGVRAWVLATAWISASLFLLAFAARPLRQFVRSDATGALLRNRRHVGVSGAFAHFLHLIAIVWLLNGFAHPGEDAVDVPTLIGGGLGFAFYFSLALTSSDAAVRALGRRNWKRLHTTGMYYVWFIFAFTFLGGAVSEGNAVSASFLLLFAAVIPLRITARLRSRSAAA